LRHRHLRSLPTRRASDLLYLLFIILILVMAASHIGKGQDLTESRRSSHYTFIYRITNEQARELYKDISHVGVSFLNSLIDFFPTDRKSTRLNSSHVKISY